MYARQHIWGILVNLGALNSALIFEKMGPDITAILIEFLFETTAKAKDEPSDAIMRFAKIYRKLFPFDDWTELRSALPTVAGVASFLDACPGVFVDAVLLRLSNDKFSILRELAAQVTTNEKFESLDVTALQLLLCFVPKRSLAMFLKRCETKLRARIFEVLSERSKNNLDELIGLVGQVPDYDYRRARLELASLLRFFEINGPVVAFKHSRALHAAWRKRPPF